MVFYAVLEQVLDLLRRRGRVSYRALKVQFNLDDNHLAALQDELIDAQRLARDEDGKVLVWMGDAAPTLPVPEPDPAPLAYTPPHLTEKSSPRAAPWRAAQAGDSAVCRPHGLDRAHPRPRPGNRPAPSWTPPCMP
jgi:hypothetical protein